MIKSIDYKFIQQKGTNSEETFSPNNQLIKFVKENESRIITIKASNSSGKSFLMNLIAFASNALNLNSNELPISLRGKVKELVSSEVSLDYNFILKDTDGSSLIFSKRSDLEEINEVKILSNSKELTSSEFSQAYKLLYDIPENPLSRLYKIVNETKNKNIDFILILETYSKYLNTVTTELENVKNQEKLDEYLSKLKESEKILPSRKEEFERIEKRFKTVKSKRLLNELYEKSTRLSRKKSDLKKLNTEYKPASNKTEENLIDDNVTIFKSYRQLQLKNRIFTIIKTFIHKYENQMDSIDKKLLKEIEESNKYLDEAFSNYEQIYFSKLKNVIESFISLRLENLIWRDSQTLDFNKYEVFLNLKQTLKEINQDEEFKTLFDNKFENFYKRVNEISDNLDGFETKTEDCDMFRKTFQEILSDIAKSEKLAKRYYNKTQKIKQTPKEAKNSARLKMH